MNDISYEYVGERKIRITLERKRERSMYIYVSHLSYDSGSSSAKETSIDLCVITVYLRFCVC